MECVGNFAHLCTWGKKKSVPDHVAAFKLFFSNIGVDISQPLVGKAYDCYQKIPKTDSPDIRSIHQKPYPGKAATESFRTVTCLTVLGFRGY
jgi:hypothetical protein